MAENKMPFSAHLEELRNRLIKILLAITAGFLGSYAFADHILEWLKNPLPQKLIFISPAEAFLANLKVSFLAGIIITLPFSLFQIWKFVTPGLKQTEKRYAFSFIVFGSLLFCSGSLFAYYVILPLGLHFLLSYGSHGIQPMISVGPYISFCMVILLMFGLIFNLPLAVVLLTKLRLLNYSLLARNRKYAVLVIFIIAALFTPPDVFTQLLLGVPLVLLYEISIWLSRLF
jgi:sec-independent protein translocase protein TatC